MARRNREDLDQKILNLLPKNGEEVRARDIYEQGKRDGLSKITIERKLKEWSDDGLLNRRDAGHMQVYYSRVENVRIKRLISTFTNGINATFSTATEDISSLMQRTANAILQEYKEKGIQLPEEEAKKMLMEDPIFVEEMGFLTFTQAVFEAFKVLLHTKVSRHEDFFINKHCQIIPSAEVYKRFNPSEIEEYNKISSSDN